MLRLTSLAGMRSTVRFWRLRSIRITGPTVFVIAYLIAQSAQGELLLSLTSDAVDPSQVSLGQTVQIRVDLSGLANGDELTALSGRVLFNAASFGTPIITSGAILPNPLDDPLDFVSLADPGTADATFLTLGTSTSDRITSNGRFFQFDVQALAPGPAVFQLVFGEAQQIDPADPGNLLSPTVSFGPALTVNVVPEPSSFVMVLAACATLCAMIGRRRF